MVYISSKYRKKVLVHLCSSFYWSLMGRKAAVKQHKHVQNYADWIFLSWQLQLPTSGSQIWSCFISRKRQLSTFQIRKVRGIVPGGCLHQREVRLAQVSCGIVAGQLNWKFAHNWVSCGQVCNIFDPNLIVHLSKSAWAPRRKGEPPRCVWKKNRRRSLGSTSLFCSSV